MGTGTNSNRQTSMFRIHFLKLKLSLQAFFSCNFTIFCMLILLGDIGFTLLLAFYFRSKLSVLHKSSHHKLTQRVELGFPEQDKGGQRGEDKDDRTQQAGSTQVDL